MSGACNHHCIHFFRSVVTGKRADLGSKQGSVTTVSTVTTETRGTPYTCAHARELWEPYVFGGYSGYSGYRGGFQVQKAVSTRPESVSTVTTFALFDPLTLVYGDIGDGEGGEGNQVNQQVRIEPGELELISGFRRRCAVTPWTRGNPMRGKNYVDQRRRISFDRTQEGSSQLRNSFAKENHE